MFEGSSMFLDVLAIVIAFSAVMLLLSVLVTALAQATQAALRLRARNLQSGLTALLQHELKAPKDSSRRLAASLLNSPEIALLRRRKDPTSRAGRVRGPLVSWVEPDQLKEAIESAQGGQASEGGGRGGAGTEGEADEPGLDAVSRIDADAVVERFKRLGTPLSKRFAMAMRIVSLVWAVMVAFAFQVSTPGLLDRLSTDPAYRASLVARADEILESGGQAIDRLEVEDATDTALEELLGNHPDLRTRIAPVAGTEDYPEGPAEDLAALLEDVPERTSIVSEFEDLLSRELEERRDAALTEARVAAGQLATLDITPWRYGGGFYWEQGPQVVNLLGVLATAILLSLGAPFWFKMLKTAAGLHDRLAPDTKNDSKRQGKES